jgi:hypothetical protein
LQGTAKSNAASLYLRAAGIANCSTSFPLFTFLILASPDSLVRFQEFEHAVEVFKIAVFDHDLSLALVISDVDSSA